MIFQIFSRSLTVRRMKGSYVDGNWIAANDNTFEIKASVQPTPAEILQTLPEGYRTLDTFTLYTETKLNTAVKHDETPDIVVINNDDYLVVKVADWHNNIFGQTNITNHYQVVVVRSDIDVA